MVLVQIEGLGREDVDDFVDSILLQHKGAEHDFFEVGGLWRDTALVGKDLLWRHQIAFCSIAERTACSDIVRHKKGFLCLF